VLRQIGTEQSVAPVAALLGDKDVSVRACIALQSLPGAKADEALRSSLGKIPTELKATVIQAIGARGDAKAAAALTPLTADKDANVASAALLALGRIGGAEAVEALKNAKPSDAALKVARSQALLFCADRLVSEGKNGEAAGIYGAAFKDGENMALRVAALRGLAASDKAQAATAIASVLKDKDRKLQIAALQCVGEAADGELAGKVLADAGALDAEQQVVLLTLARDKAVLPAALKAMSSDNTELRTAAIRAVGRVGGASEIPALLALATKGGADGKEAQAALGALKDQKADDALLGLLGGADAPARAAALQMLKGRNVARALPEIIKAAGDADESVRLAALEAVAALAGADRYPDAVQLLLAARSGSDNERAAAETAVVAVARKVEKAADRLAPLAGGLKSGAAPAKASVLRVLSILAGPEALQMVKERLQDGDAAVAEGALRALAEWPDTSAADELLKLLQQAKEGVPRTLALRGYLRLARLPDVTPQARTKMLEQAKPLAKNDQEKKQVLSCLSGTGSAEALELAAGFLDDQPVRAEAELAVLATAKAVSGKADRKRVEAVLKKLTETSQNKENVAHAKLLLGASSNIAPSGKAASLAGWQPDGQGGPASVAIDNNPETYWDEEDGKKLYRIAVTFEQPRNVGSISILGFQHHSYAPKDFDIIADGKVIKEVRNAEYTDNLLRVAFPPVQLKNIELKITGYYGASPAIREWGIYEP